MTVGEKIKYYRNALMITQGTLAKLAHIHPVSIRKYETNKMHPQPPQMEKIADALGVSYSALIGIDNNGLRLETVGDLMGFLMILVNADILQITGEYDEKGFLKPAGVKIKFNPILMYWMEILYSVNNDEKKLSFEDAILNIKSERVLTNLLKWEKLNRSYKEIFTKYKDNKNEAIQSTLDEIRDNKEKIELELQRSNMLLDESNGITVKINPDYEIFI